MEDPAARYRAALPALKRLSPMPELISTAAALQLLSAELRPGRRFTVGVEAECIRRETASAAAVASAGRATAHAAVWRRAHPPHPSPPQATSDDLDSRASTTPRMPRVPPSPHPTAGVVPGTPVTPQMAFSTPSVYHTGGWAARRYVRRRRRRTMFTTHWRRSSLWATAAGGGPRKCRRGCRAEPPPPLRRRYGWR